ncbi:MAG: hypothetical protein ACXWDT_07790 [Solirubrobacterales bacterium]
MSRRLIGALAAGALAAGMLATAGGSAAAATPKIGTYDGRAAGGKLIDIEVVQRHGVLRVRLLDLEDNCGSSFVLTPIGLGTAKGGFHGSREGRTDTVAYRVVLDGHFTSRTRASVTVLSSVGDLFPPPGAQPGAPISCSETTQFTLKFLPDGL